MIRVIDNGPGIDATFSIYLPEARPSGETHRAGQDRSSEATTVQGLRVLIVDDDARVAHVLSQMVSAMGHTVVSVPGCSRAVGAVVNAEEPFDLVLLDEWMPETRGSACFLQLREAQPGLPAIIVSGHSTIEGLDDPIGYGLSAVLTKPVTLDELRRAITAAAVPPTR